MQPLYVLTQMYQRSQTAVIFLHPRQAIRENVLNVLWVMAFGSKLSKRDCAYVDSPFMEKLLHSGVLTAIMQCYNPHHAYLLCSAAAAPVSGSPAEVCMNNPLHCAVGHKSSS